MKSLALSAALAATSLAAEEPPNIVVILTDDQGYADISFNPEHPEEVSTPHMDALAEEGVFFTQAYTSGHVCSPTRAGLMLGRYQQRVGIYTAGDGGSGFDPELPIFPSFLPQSYTSTAIGKWHLGLDEDYPELKWHAMSRGFDECYKFMGRGGHDYFSLKGVKDGEYEPIYRGKKRLSMGEYEGYLTTRLTEEAVDFIGREKDDPFFLYLAYNAVHSPAQAPQEDIDRYRAKFPGITEERAILMAMLEHLDLGVGAVVKKLKDEGEWDNTLLFFLTDNGGSKAMEADNGSLKGYKGSLSEGGIRTPWIVSWPAKFEGGRTIDTPVISLDILPTTLDAVGIEFPTDETFDGKSLLPLLTGESEELHETLYWNSGEPKGEWAVRQGDWKAHGFKEKYSLYNLAKDPSEETDVTAANPELAKKLAALHEAWLADVRASAGESPKVSSKERKSKGKKVPKETAALAPVSKGKAKNVLFVVCDDLNTHVSTSGYSPIQTPTLAALAEESMNFTRAFCQYPVCGPSRASFLNGLYPQSSGVINNTADIRQERPNTVSMPQFFKQNGFWTASVGKVFHSSRHEHGEVAWNEFHRFENDELPVAVEARKAFEAEHGSIDDRENRKAWKEALKEAIAPLNAQTPPGYGRSGLADEQHKDGKNARQVVQWLKEKPYGDQPFFIALGIQKPHVPFLAPDAYFDQYPLDEVVYTPDPPDLWDSLPKTAISKRYEAFGFEFAVENDTLRREYMQAYHACISFIDAQLGLVVETLKEEGLWEDTVIVFTSDHGYHLGDHFLWGKVTLFDIGAKVPFLVRAPGVTRPASHSEAMVELIDIYPTLTELTGLEAPDHLQGESLVPVLKDPEAKRTKKYAYSIVSRGPQLGHALRDHRFRYAKWPDGEELYNLRRDPEEKVNLANREGFEQRLEGFRELLAERESLAASKR